MSFWVLQALKKSTEEKTSIQTFSDDEIPSDVDLNDPYFSSELLPEQKKSKCHPFSLVIK